MIALLLSVALAWDEPALVSALEAELARSQADLRLPDSPAIYHLRYKLALLEQVDVEADLGGIVHVDVHPYAALGVEVRVGDPAWDNTGFGGWQDGFRARGLGREPTPESVRRDAWRVTDGAYKDAVEQYSRKAAQAVRPDDHPGDYRLTGPVRAGGRGPELADPAALQALAERLSGALAAVPGVEFGRVYLGHEAGAVWVLDSEGTAVRRPVAELTLRAVAQTRDGDGGRLTDARLWTVATADALPGVAEMESEVRAMAAALVARRDAPRLTEEYVGPVLFEGAAAADLFRWMLLGQLEGTPAEIPFDSFLGDIGAEGGGARLLRRVLPPGWGVVDDPRAVPAHPGSFTHDWEGTPAEAVRLVEDGIVQTLLTSRVPREGVAGSNGHGRAGLGRRAEGKPSLTTVTPDRSLSTARLRRAALRAAAAYGRDHVLVVRRFQQPALLGLDDPDHYGLDGDLPPPVEVVRLYADGREEALRGAALSSVHRWALRDVLAAGRAVTLDYLSPHDGDESALGPTQGAPCRIVAPEVLVGELELVPLPGDPAAVRRLPAP